MTDLPLSGNFHSLLLGVQMMFSFMLTDEKSTLRVCKHCGNAFIGQQTKQRILQAANARTSIMCIRAGRRIKNKERTADLWKNSMSMVLKYRYYRLKKDDYISLTDMVRKIDNGPALIEKWLRNKNTIEFLGIWEEMYNEDF